MEGNQFSVDVVSLVGYLLFTFVATKICSFSADTFLVACFVVPKLNRQVFEDLVCLMSDRWCTNFAQLADLVFSGVSAVHSHCSPLSDRVTPPLVCTAVLHVTMCDDVSLCVQLKKLRSILIAGGTNYDELYQHLRLMEPALQLTVQDLRYAPAPAGGRGSSGTAYLYQKSPH